DLFGLTEIAFGVAGKARHFWLLDINRVNFGAEVDEDLRRRRAHARRRARHDDALARVLQNVHQVSIVIARSGQFSAPMRACSASAPSTSRTNTSQCPKSSAANTSGAST